MMLSPSWIFLIMIYIKFLFIQSFEVETYLLTIKYVKDLKVKRGETSACLVLSKVFPDWISVAVELSSLFRPGVRGAAMVLTCGVSSSEGVVSVACISLLMTKSWGASSSICWTWEGRPFYPNLGSLVWIFWTSCWLLPDSPRVLVLSTRGFVVTVGYFGWYHNPIGLSGGGFGIVDRLSLYLATVT